MSGAITAAVIAGLLAAGGATMQASAAAKASKAQGKAQTDLANQQTMRLKQQAADNQIAQQQIQLEQEQQGKFRENAGNIADTAIVDNSRPAQDEAQDQYVNARMAGYDKLAELNPISIDLGSSKGAPSVVGDSIMKSIASATAKAKEQAQAKSAIEGFGDLNLGNKLALRDNANTIGTISKLNNISSVLAGQQDDYMKTLAGITSGQIGNDATAINSVLAKDMLKSSNMQAGGDAMFKIGATIGGAAANKLGSSASTTTTNAPTTYGPYYVPKGAY